MRACTILRPVFARDRQVLLEQIVHPLLDTIEVLGGEGLLHLEVVVEPVVDGWPDGELDLRKQLHHRVRQHV